MHGVAPWAMQRFSTSQQARPSMLVWRLPARQETKACGSVLPFQVSMWSMVRPAPGISVWNMTAPILQHGTPLCNQLLIGTAADEADVHIMGHDARPKVG